MYQKGAKNVKLPSSRIYFLKFAQHRIKKNFDTSNTIVCIVGRYPKIVAGTITTFFD